MSPVVFQNPFSTRFTRPGVISWHSTSTSPSGLLKSLEELDDRALISGPHGSGKSTLLSHCCAAARAQGYEVYYFRCYSWVDVVRAVRLLVESSPKHDFVCIDSLEMLRFFGWFFCLVADFRRVRVVVTVHKRPWWCMWPVLVNTETSFRTFHELVRGLMAKCSPMETINFSKVMLQDIFKRNAGNLRESFFELYDQYEVHSRTLRQIKNRQ